ncbi:MAG: hypothetical protein FD180_3794 [Planctomycetota bacterium]|nr:MAG: hypothetical protein FD180_3794 [Planctomycetota bacterium]
MKPAACAIALSFLCAALSDAGVPCLHQLADGDVIVVTVGEALTKDPTHGNPPVAEIEVTEVLRGDKQVERTKALFAPMPNDIDWDGGDSEKLREEWSKKPMEAPKKGDRLILGGAMGKDGVFVVSPICVYAAGDKQREEVLALIDKQLKARAEFEAMAKKEKEGEEARRQAWRKDVLEGADLDRLVAGSSFIGLGKISSQMLGKPMFITWSIDGILKGKKTHEYTGDAYFATALVSRDQMIETTREERYFVFLNEIPNARGNPERAKRVEGGAGGPDYTLADEKTGILPWSEDLEKQVRERIGKK